MYKVDTKTGLLENVEYRASPNFNERPDPDEINAIIIHGISLPAGEFGGPWIDTLFMNHLQGNEHPSFQELAGLEVSSHLLIRRDGKVIQYVPFHKRAWHAGVSELEGRENCNDFSIGIELEGTDVVPYEIMQYDALAQVVRGLLDAYPQIVKDRIVGHSDIAPGRKTDPGEAFDWTLFYNGIN